MMNTHRKKFIRLVLPSFLALSTLCILRCNNSADNSNAEEASGDSAPVPVSAAEAQLMTLRPSIHLRGTLVEIPENTVSLSVQASGQVEEVLVHENEEVASEQEILRLDNRMVKARMDKIAAALDEAQASLRALEKGALPEEIEALRQDVVKFQALASSLKKKHDALVPMQERGEVSEIRFQQSEAELRAAQAESQSASAKLKQLQAGTRQEVLDQASARVHAVSAELSEAKLMLDLCSVKSPIDGVVTSLPTQQGMFIEPPTMVAMISNQSQLFVRLRIPGELVNQINLNTLADIQVSAAGSEVLKGSIARIGRTADPRTSEIEVFAQVDNTAGTLVPGLACDARIWLPEIPNALAIPRESVADRDGTPVATVVREEKAYEVEITLGAQTDEYTQIVDGIQAGELVVTEGGYALPDGCPVTLKSD